MAAAVPLSVVIITLNEAANLPRCLAALEGVADEVLVVDSGSTDATVALAEAAGARVVYHAFENYVAQKNAATALATYDHVLQLDADEVLTSELRTELAAVKAHWQHPGYALPRLTNYCGTWVRHGGWYPDRKTRLYDRRLGQWQGHLIHEHWEPNAPGAGIGQLRHDLLHYSYTSIAQHVRQLNHFTTLTAHEAVARGKHAHWWQLLLKPPYKFLHGYLLRGGFRDGFAGFSIAVLSAAGVFIKFAKMRADPHPRPLAASR